MVAAERMKLAEAEAELREAEAEKDALRSALKLVEHQRRESESQSNSPALPSMSNHAHKRSSSSAIAIKSLPSTAPSSPRSMLRHAVEIVEHPSGRASVPPPLDLPEVGLAHASVESSPSELSVEDAVNEDDAKEKPRGPGGPEDEGDETKVDDAEETPATARDATKMLAPPEVAVTSATPSPSPTPSPGQFGYPSSRSVSYFDVEEESPWADARSSSPLPSTAI